MPEEIYGVNNDGDLVCSLSEPGFFDPSWLDVESHSSHLFDWTWNNV